MALKMDRLKMSPGPNGTTVLAMDVTKDELGNAPTFKPRKDLDAEQAAEQRRSEPRPSPRTN